MSDIPANLQRLVARRAGGRCEYCELSQEGQELAISHRPRGACNARRGDHRRELGAGLRFVFVAESGEAIRVGSANRQRSGTLQPARRFMGKALWLERCAGCRAYAYRQGNRRSPENEPASDPGNSPRGDAAGPPSARLGLAAGGQPGRKCPISRKRGPAVGSCRWQLPPQRQGFVDLPRLSASVVCRGDDG